MAKGRTLFLLDTMALAYRAYYAFISRPRINSRGVNTSAVYGFTTTLIKLVRDFGLEHAAVVLDASEETFRREIYPPYKANREPPPEDLLTNLPFIREVATALSIPVYEVASVEADDVIGTLARQAEAEGSEAVIVSPDKDFQQLLSPHITMFRPARRGEEFDRITEATFRDKFGMEPSRFIDILALMGDSADNVPGIRGIGEKTAARLIAAYGSVEELLAQAAEVKGKRAREGLLAAPEMARLSKYLVTIKTDVDVRLDWDAASRGDLAAADVRKVFRKLEFNTLLERIAPDAGTGKPARQAAGGRTRHDPSQQDFRLVGSREELVALERTLRTQAAVGVHALLTDVRPVWAEWTGLSLAWTRGSACLLPFPLEDGTPASEVVRILAPVFTNPNIRKVGHGLKPLLVRLGLGGVRVRGELVDTEVAHYLLTPETNHSLQFVARERLGYDPVTLKEVMGKGRTLGQVAPGELVVTACESAALPLQLERVLTEDLDKQGLGKVAAAMEYPLVGTLADMERAGVIVDTAQLQATGQKLTTEIAGLEGRIFSQAGRTFQIASPQQVGDVLFGQLGLPVRQKTASGQPSTREDVLAALATEHPLPGLILDWRRATRLLGTYVEGLRKMIHPRTGRVHTVFNQTVAATGRLSSSHPGLQNIPVRRSSGREMRRAFVAPEGWHLLSADYAQIELRILAHMSGDSGLVEIFGAGRDLHTETAARIFRTAADQVTREQRDRAKAVNYGIPYGLSATGLAQQLRCSHAEARKLMKIHEASFPGVAVFLHEQVEKARAQGYAETLWGRRRYLPNITARNRMVRSAAERIAVNMPIQGTQADMIKLAAVTIHRRLQHGGFRTRLVLQVHDELLFEVPDYELDEVRGFIVEDMREALPLSVPVEVDAGIGPTWLDAH